MADKAPRTKPAAALRAGIGGVRDLAGELGELADGMAVTEMRPPVELLPPQRRRRRDLSSLGTPAGGRPAPPLVDVAPAAVPPADAAPAAAAPADTHPALGATSPRPAELLDLPLQPAVTPPPAPPPTPPVELEDVDPTGRPWSLAAAMEPVAGPEAPAAPGPGEPQEDRHPWLISAVAIGAVVLAILVVVASRLDLGHTLAPAFAVNELRIVHSPDDPNTTTSDGHFTTTAPSIIVDVNFLGASPTETLTLHVTHDGSALPDQTQPFGSSTGMLEATLRPGPRGFAPGAYTVTAIWHGASQRTATFTVDPPGAAGPSPAA